MRPLVDMHFYPPRTNIQLLAGATLFLALSVITSDVAFIDLDLPEYWVTLSPTNVHPYRQFLLDNAFFNILGYGLTAALGGGHAISVGMFKTTMTLITFACFATLVLGSLSAYGPERAGVFLACISLTTLDYTLLHWIGKTDPLLVMAYCIVFFGRKKPIASAIGFFLIAGFHLEQALIIGLIHIIIIQFERSISFNTLCGIATGIAAAACIFFWYKSTISVGARMDRAEFARIVLLQSLAYFVGNWYIAVVTVMFGAWWLVIREIADSWRGFFYLSAATGLATLASAATLDYSRVATLLAMPISFYLAKEAASRWKPGMELGFTPAAACLMVALLGIEIRSGVLTAFGPPFRDWFRLLRSGLLG